ncbi:MAG: redoxin domain-containing protein [Acidimicrobiia bacterium]
MSSFRRVVLLIAVLAALASACTPSSEPDSTIGNPDTLPGESVDETTPSGTGPSYAGTVDAPEFPDGLDWINTAEPVSLTDLRGKVVLLDFWTYGCINCLHIIPDLERLESEYRDELVVIGVHSAKFTNEAETGNLVDIVQRYGLKHPVVNDKDFEIWNAWGASAWPTVAVIDPAGKIVGVRPGEGVYDAVEPVIASLVAEFDAKRAIDRAPIEFALEATTAPVRALRYPGKVLAVDGRLWIADTGHHRVLEVDPATGRVLAVFGNGTIGFDDGAALDASFSAPQGLALNPGTDELYVADVGNNAVRVIDLASGEVSTLAGSGALGWPPQGRSFDTVALNSPWAVAYRDGFVYVANAGSHQIWALDLDNELALPLIGNAREGTSNGSFHEAELAQPSGLALSEDGHLYVADSESSSIRVGDLDAATIDLVVGGDASLFEFGDVDGAGNEARLQHPLGVAIDRSTLYVADTYNSKIKRVDVASGTITSWLGGEPGWADGTDPHFNEPGGLSIDGGLLYVADTNNHAIRVVDTDTGVVSTMVLKGIEDFDPPGEYVGETVTLPAMEASSGVGTIVVDYRLPDGYKVNDDAPSSLEIAKGHTIVALTDDTAGDLTGTALPAVVPVDFAHGVATVAFDLNIVYCAADAESLCYIDRVRYEIPLTVEGPGVSTRIELQRTIIGS